MKKLMLNVVALLFLGTLAVQAQSTPSSTQPLMSSVQQQQPRSSDWAKVEPNKIPAPVQQTLRSDKYKGWESNGLYFNKSTNQYSVDIRTGATPDLYYFDQNGRNVTATSTPQPGATGSSSRSTPNVPNSSGSTPQPPSNPQ